MFHDRFYEREVRKLSIALALAGSKPRWKKELLHYLLYGINEDQKQKYHQALSILIAATSAFVIPLLRERRLLGLGASLSHVMR